LQKKLVDIVILMFHILIYLSDIIHNNIKTVYSLVES